MQRADGTFRSGPLSDQYLNTEKARPVGGFSEMLDMVSQSLSARGTDENFQELNSGDRVTDSSTCTDAEEIEAGGVPLVSQFEMCSYVRYECEERNGMRG